MSPAVVPRPRIAVYARQSEDVDQGIVQQLDDCRAEAARRGWRVVAEFRDNDTGASKARGPKTDWIKMLREFDAGTFDVLLVTETSRLPRPPAMVMAMQDAEAGRSARERGKAALCRTIDAA